MTGNFGEDASGFAEAPSGYPVAEGTLLRVVAVIPALDEALSIAGVVETLLEGRTITLHRVLVVDNGSNDETGEIARRAGVSPTTVGKLRRDLVDGI